MRLTHEELEARVRERLKNLPDGSYQIGKKGDKIVAFTGKQGYISYRVQVEIHLYDWLYEAHEKFPTSNADISDVAPGFMVRTVNDIYPPAPPIPNDADWVNPFNGIQDKYKPKPGFSLSSPEQTPAEEQKKDIAWWRSKMDSVPYTFVNQLDKEKPNPIQQDNHIFPKALLEERLKELEKQAREDGAWIHEQLGKFLNQHDPAEETGRYSPYYASIDPALPDAEPIISKHTGGGIFEQINKPAHYKQLTYEKMRKAVKDLFKSYSPPTSMTIFTSAAGLGIERLLCDKPKHIKTFIYFPKKLRAVYFSLFRKEGMYKVRINLKHLYTYELYHGTNLIGVYKDPKYLFAHDFKQ